MRTRRFHAARPTREIRSFSGCSPKNCAGCGDDITEARKSNYAICDECHDREIRWKQRFPQSQILSDREWIIWLLQVFVTDKAHEVRDLLEDEETKRLQMMELIATGT